jgi:hypothetical protein
VSGRKEKVSGTFIEKKCVGNRSFACAQSCARRAKLLKEIQKPPSTNGGPGGNDPANPPSTNGGFRPCPYRSAVNKRQYEPGVAYPLRQHSCPLAPR